MSLAGSSSPEPAVAAALFADPAFAEGEYAQQPETGIAAFGTVWAAWLYSQQWWRDEL